MNTSPSPVPVIAHFSSAHKPQPAIDESDTQEQQPSGLLGSESPVMPGASESEMSPFLPAPEDLVHLDLA